MTRGSKMFTTVSHAVGSTRYYCLSAKRFTTKCKGTMTSLISEIRSCVHCSPHLAAGPRPIVQFSRTARIVIIGQAPGHVGARKRHSWDDASGQRLREWTGLTSKIFYDPTRIALVPMGFCYPGTGTSGDLPPRPGMCAAVARKGYGGITT